MVLDITKMQKFVFTCFVICFLSLSACTANSKEAAFDWKNDWAVEENFALDIDSEGYQYPTAIAFVPTPGSEAKDPLYFVTELTGKVKVVTNDRTVYTFADDFLQIPFYDIPAEGGEYGLAGICLDPAHGYVFVTYAYPDSSKIIRNNIIRFTSKPETFSLDSSAQLAFTEVFAPYETGRSHQIGPCQVNGEDLYVSVGDGLNSPRTSQQLDSIQGKIIRLTLDGKPAPDNPYYQDDDIRKAANYVWAYGLRNPFSLKLVENRLFVAENGPSRDRFYEIKKGENYLWDGTDDSMVINAAAVIAPSLAPVQMDYYPGSLSIFPESYRQKFYVALAGKTYQQRMPGIMLFDYGLEKSRMLSPPKYFLKYRGKEFQVVAGLAFGPDGLYFAPLLANEAGLSAIFKVTYDPEHKFPFTMKETKKPFDLMYEKGCLGCHSLAEENGDGRRGGTAGPPLDREALIDRLQARLNTEAYVDSLKEIDKLDTEPQRSYKNARQEVVAAEGPNRVRAWLKYRIQEPKFDNLYSQMPNLGVSEKEAITITNYLLEEDEKEGVSLRALIPGRTERKHLIYAFLGGLVIGGCLLALAWWTLPKFRHGGE